ncbi:hypothetical protein GCM10018785_66170 [Streptomyces longispororuber]|uniref:Uncharacterized protein n=1 Tax=Streptomyces longispororuber TaxID=68230 RepID=A0A919DXX7_9ACTN|nr:hypothetical protein GCM10018785_66170 [Streptomyces longispororuber]
MRAPGSERAGIRPQVPPGAAPALPAWFPGALKGAQCPVLPPLRGLFPATFHPAPARARPARTRPQLAVKHGNLGGA